MVTVCLKWKLGKVNEQAFWLLLCELVAHSEQIKKKSYCRVCSAKFEQNERSALAGNSKTSHDKISFFNFYKTRNCIFNT